MTRPFANDPFLTNNYAPIRSENDAPNLVIEGDLPHELQGTLYRNGPNPLSTLPGIVIIISAVTA